MHPVAGGFAGGVQVAHGGAAINIRLNPAHHVVLGRGHRDLVFGHIVTLVHAGLKNVGKALVGLLAGHIGQGQVHMVGAEFLFFFDNGLGHYIPGL